MPITNYDVRAASAVVKREADARGSRDEGTVLAAVGPLEVGTIMVRDNAGALTALVGAAGAAANCVLLEAVPTGNAASRVVVLWRDADVVRSELRFPTGYSAGDMTDAIFALRNQGIAARAGV
tara:strand:+ start:5321 stop:5689 length:369 start_codon:yes stop_codon:yes gene_type:complete